MSFSRRVSRRSPGALLLQFLSAAPHAGFLKVVRCTEVQGYSGPDVRGLGTKEFNKLVEERLLVEIMPSVLALLTETQSCCQLGLCRVAHFLGYSQHLSRGQDVARTYPVPRVHAAVSFCFTGVKLLVDLSRLFISVSGASGRNTGGLMQGSCWRTFAVEVLDFAISDDSVLAIVTSVLQRVRAFG